MTNYIWITTTFEGFHSYKKASEDISFLRNIHRHLFYVKVYIEIKDGIDREIEFFQFKRFIEDIISKTNLNDKSCEMISNTLYDNIKKKYPNRKVKIIIGEDQENGTEFNY